MSGHICPIMAGDERIGIPQKIATICSPNGEKGVDRRAIIRNLKDELKPGTLHAIVKQLGIEESDLY
jgi:hypothetical protein